MSRREVGGYWILNYDGTQRFIIKFSPLQAKTLGTWFKLAVSKLFNQQFQLTVQCLIPQIHDK